MLLHLPPFSERSPRPWPMGRTMFPILQVVYCCVIPRDRPQALVPRAHLIVVLPFGSWVQCPGRRFRIDAGGADGKHLRTFPLRGVLNFGSNEGSGQTMRAGAARPDDYAADAAIDRARAGSIGLQEAAATVAAERGSATRGRASAAATIERRWYGAICQAT